MLRLAQQNQRVAGGTLQGCTGDIQGQLQVHHQGQWRAVCRNAAEGEDNYGFHVNKAKLACYSMGLLRPRKTIDKTFMMDSGTSS